MALLKDRHKNNKFLKAVKNMMNRTNTWEQTETTKSRSFEGAVHWKTYQDVMRFSTEFDGRYQLKRVAGVSLTWVDQDYHHIVTLSGNQYRNNWLNVYWTTYSLGEDKGSREHLSKLAEQKF